MEFSYPVHICTHLQFTLLMVGGENTLSQTPGHSVPLNPCVLLFLVLWFCFSVYSISLISSVWASECLKTLRFSRTKTELVGSLFLMFCISALPPIKSPFSYSSHDSGRRNKTNKTETKPQLSRIYRALTAYQTLWTFFKTCAGDSSPTTLLSPLHRLGYWDTGTTQPVSGSPGLSPSSSSHLCLPP